MVRVGTSGFSYADWVGPFYPAGLDRREMLSFYSGRFPLVELDFTYYRMPKASTLEVMVSRTPPHFLFCVKTYKDFTHRRDLSGAELRALAGAFRAALDPMVSAGKLGCILAQFPWSFRPGPESTESIASLRASLPDLPLVIEFRNSEWLTAQTYQLLSDFDLSFCCVDEPRLPGLLPSLALATNGLGYIRFHGRNAAKWWRHENAWERYDYNYSDSELAEWVPKVKALASQTAETFILMNNCHAGYAAMNAIRFQRMLAEAGEE